VCCNIHKDQTPVPYYNRPDENWPTVETVNNNVHMYNSMDVIMSVLYNYSIDMQLSSFTIPSLVDRAYKRCLILSTEHIKRNNSFCYGMGYLENTIKAYYKILIGYPQLARYAENFRKLCLKSYRDQAKKNMVTFYFKHVEGLYPDVVEHIMSFY